MRTLRLLTLLLTTTTLVSVGLVAPAQAATYADTDSGGSGNFSNQSVVLCTPSNVVSTTASNTALVENGPAAVTTQAHSGRLTLDSDSTDVIDFASSITSRARITSSGGNPATMTLDATGTVRSTASKGTSQCRGAAYSFAWMKADFSVTDPGFILYEHRATKHNFAMIQIQGPDNRDIELENDIRAWNGAGRVFIGPGVHKLYLEADAWIDQTSVTVPTTPVSVSLHLTYAKAGSALAQATGKAKKYVTFPKSRSCAAHEAELKLKGKASKASTVKVLVNGKTVKTVKNPKGSEKIKLKLTDTTDAAVVARVTLKPTKKGAKPVTVESAGSYLACA